ncbi:MAG: YciK family oxidoreductase [Gammaproteobacteria bacterium]|nr:YciK family oxidoreductase [Gammaproteobacteria bacterium]MBT5203923.1 YciK family oxidoreductase [Gammaproteobacteria bacterium]MBT5602148.1 YciK family oxidoreductase [Gammaproteobacteria bacterium]MBT6243930.1 YciK family oxidoreductase [Gammaproteobacteria bacterium]
MSDSPYQPASDLLKDKVILVTGAGDGIGRVAAKTFTDHGATVLLLGKTVSKLEALYDEILPKSRKEPGIIPMDLATTTVAIIEELVVVLQQRYGRLDGLLHNAAILGDRVPVEHYDIEQWQTVMQANYHAPFLLTRLLMPLLRAAPKASLLFTSSGVGAIPRAYWGAYAASKYALEGFAKLLADEIDTTSNIRVNIINPGATRTSMRAAAYPGEDPVSVKMPEELMPLYLYLMGDDSSADHAFTFNSDHSKQPFNQA